MRNLLLPVLKQTGNKGYFPIDPEDINLASSRNNNLGMSNLLIACENFLDRVRAGEENFPTPTDEPRNGWLKESNCGANP